MTSHLNFHIQGHDLITKFPTQHPYCRPRLDSISLIVSSNSLPANPKYYYLLSNLSQSISGQAPAIIKAKRSVASFKLRKNSPVAIHTTLRKSKACTLLDLLTFFYIPQLVSLNPTYTLPSPLRGPRFAAFKESGFAAPPQGGEAAEGWGFRAANTNLVYSFGFDDISYFTHLRPLAILPQLPQNFVELGTPSPLNKSGLGRSSKKDSRRRMPPSGSKKGSGAASKPGTTQKLKKSFAPLPKGRSSPAQLGGAAAGGPKQVGGYVQLHVTALSQLSSGGFAPPFGGEVSKQRSCARRGATLIKSPGAPPRGAPKRSGPPLREELLTPASFHMTQLIPYPFKFTP